MAKIFRSSIDGKLSTKMSLGISATKNNDCTILCGRIIQKDIIKFANEICKEMCHKSKTLLIIINTDVETIAVEDIYGG